MTTSLEYPRVGFSVPVLLSDKLREASLAPISILRHDTLDIAVERGVCAELTGIAGLAFTFAVLVKRPAIKPHLHYARDVLVALRTE